MRNKMPLFAVVCILAIFLLSTAVVYGGNDIVDIFVNQVKIQIEGNKTDIPNILYDDKTYVALREICNELGLKLDWDKTTNTAKLSGFSGSRGDLLHILLYLLSKTLVISGALLMAQVAFSRMKKDFYYVKKFNASATSLKRLIYTSSSTRIGFYFIALGILTDFFASGTNPALWVKITFLPLLVLIFWFLGLGTANSISRREQAEILDEQN